YTPGLRANFYPSSGGEIVKQLFEILRREILKKILIDLDHRGIAASAETLDLNPRKLAVGSDSSRPANPPLKNCLDRVRPSKHTRSRAAHLDMEFATRREIKHRIKGGDLKHANIWHAELLRALLDCGFRQQKIIFFLRLPQKRNHRRRLTALRIF